MRSSRGQATVDYVALIAIVAVALGAALARATSAAPGIVNAVAGQIRHALCVVGGGPCRDPAPRPCTVASTRDARHIALSVLLVRIDDDRYVLRERMSDGTVRLTVARSNGAGVETGIGARAHVTLRGRTVGVSGEARAAAQGVLGAGRVFVARDERAADALVRAIRAGRSPPSAPREEFVEGGLRGLGQIGIGPVLAAASLDALAGTTIGARRDLRSGDVTLAVSSGAFGWGAVTVALGGPAGTAERATTLGLTLDRRRRPIELSLSAAGTLAAGAALPPGLERALGAGAALPRGSARVRGGGAAWSMRAAGRRWELAARLDLRDPAAAAAWARVRRAPGSGAAIRALGEAIRDRAHLDVRTYRTDSASTGAAGGVSAGVRVGGEFDRTIDRSRLLAASSRPPGGLWEPRVDCVRS